MNEHTGIVEGMPPISPLAIESMPDIRTNEPTFKEVFFAWEKLRLIYNAILSVVVLARIGLDVQDFIPQLFETAMIANACFCAGPVFEGYLCCLTMRRVVARCLVFALGTLLAIYYAAIVVGLIVNNLLVFPG